MYRGEKVLNYTKYKKMLERYPTSNTTPEEIIRISKELQKEYNQNNDIDMKISDDARRIEIYAKDVSEYINTKN